MTKIENQLYKNLQRTYYHGSRLGLDSDKANFGFLFITTNPIYALAYSRTYDLTKYNQLFEIRFQKPVNILNLRSQNDIDYVKEVLKNEGFDNEERDQILRDLANKDWFSLFGEYREGFLNFLDFCKYDGFFNFEVTDVIGEGSRFRNELKMMGMSNIGAVGLLSVENVTMNEVKPHSIPEIVKRIDDEYETARFQAYANCRKGMSREANRQDMVDRCDVRKLGIYTSLLMSDVDEIIEEVYNTQSKMDDYFKNYRIANIRNAARNDGYTGDFRPGAVSRFW